MQYTLERTFSLSPFETDKNHLIKIGTLLNYMQIVAAQSIADVNSKYSIENLAQKGLGWFLIRYRLEFNDYPQNIDEIKIFTQCRGANKITTYRDFIVYDNKTEKQLLKATSSWFIVNLNSKSVINISQEFPDFKIFVKQDNDIQLKKIKTLEKYDREKTFSVMYDDMDMNGHVNNTVYTTWAMESLDYDFRQTHKLKTLDIYYKHEVTYGDEIISLSKIDQENLNSQHLIKNSKTQEDVCLINAEFLCL